MRKSLALVAIAPALMLTACGSGADPDAIVETIRLTEQSQLDSIASDDLVGIARLYADEAVLVRPDGSRLEGGAAIAEEYGDLVEDPNFALTIEPVSGWASTAEDLAVLTSLVDFTTSDPETGEPVTMPLASQTVWTRETGGTWTIVSAYNVPVVTADTPADAEAEAPAEAD